MAPPSSSDSPRPILGAWKARLYAEHLRILLHYVGEDFDDVYFHLEKPSGDEKPAPFVDLSNIDLPKLPLYIDGDIKITHSHAILRYLGRKYKLYGANADDRKYIDMCIEQLSDIWLDAEAVAVCGRKIWEPQNDRIGRRLAAIEKLLGDKAFVAGHQISIADFLLYEILDELRLQKQLPLDPFPRQLALVERMEALPPIAEFIRSGRSLKNHIMIPARSHFCKLDQTYYTLA